MLWSIGLEARKLSAAARASAGSSLRRTTPAGTSVSRSVRRYRRRADCPHVRSYATAWAHAGQARPAGVLPRHELEVDAAHQLGEEGLDLGEGEGEPDATAR